MSTDNNHISDVRRHLLDTLADLRNRDQPMEIDRARAVADVARVLVDTAKVEVEYLKATGQESTPFLEARPDALPGDAAGPFPQLAEGVGTNGITSITRHHLRG